MGYQFDGWSGDIENNVGGNISLSVVMDRDRIITADFIAPGGLYTITVNANPGYGGSVTIETPFESFTTSVNQPSVSVQCVSGTTVNITSLATGDYRFNEWKGEITGHQGNKSFIVSSSGTITAEFSIPFSLPWTWISIIIVASILSLLFLVWLIFGISKKLKKIQPELGVEQRTKTIQEDEQLEK